jgi:hypothetical protein
MEDTIDNNILNRRAHQNPSTVNPLISFSQSKIISALMTKRNKPSVKIVIGKVSIISIGLTSAFNIANTTATINAVINPSICTPFSIYERPKATRAEISIRIRKFMVERFV